MQPAVPATRAVRGALDRWFEVTSVLPLAAFAVLHVGAYGRVLLGVSELGPRSAPSGGLLALEALLIWVPFVFHVAVAPSRWLGRRREPPDDPSERASLALHRVAGVVLGLFLLDHFLRFRLPILRGVRYPAESLQMLAAELSRTVFGLPLVAGLHLLGALALGFHLGYGLWRIAGRHPRLTSFRATLAVCAGTGALTALVSTLVILRLAAG